MHSHERLLVNILLVVCGPLRTLASSDPGRGGQLRVLRRPEHDDASRKTSAQRASIACLSAD